jgi:DNA-directed RNA polymerase subunit beta'
VGKVDFAKVDALLRDLSVDTTTHKITYSMFPINTRSVYEENGTKLVMARANVEAHLKNTGEKSTYAVDLLKIPYYGETGFVIKGKNRQVIDLYTMSYGWYILKTAQGFKDMPHLKLSSNRGKNMLIYEKDYQLYITTGKKSSDPAVPLGVFLKAFTGLSYNDLARKIGIDNIYVASTLSKEEPIKADCIDIVLKTLFDEFRDGKRAIELNNMGVDARYAHIYSRFFSSSYMVLGDTAGVRMKVSMSFRDRCKGMILAEDVKVLDNVYKAGTQLDARILEEIDYSPIDELKVYNSNKNFFIVRKSSIFNFRALGMKLEQDLKVEQGVLQKGIILSVDDLRRLDDLEISSIAVSDGDRVYNCTRKVFTGTLNIEDMIGMIQVYLDSLTGIDCFHNVYDLTNQNLVTLEIKALSLIKEHIKRINSSIAEYAKNPGVGDLLIKIMTIPSADTNDLLSEITSVDYRESQQAELNNTIQRVAKEYRVSKNVKRSSPDMVTIQESQFGRLDPIDSPESGKIGIVQNKTFLSKINSSGFITAPYIRVNNGVLTSKEPLYLTAEEQRDQYIAEWNESFHIEDPIKGKMLKAKVRALYNNTFMDVPVKDVVWMEYSPFQTMSPARMQISLQEFSAPKRILMGCNYQKQAVPSIKNQRPFVSTGGDSLIDEGTITAKDILNEYYVANRELLKGIDQEAFLQATLVLKNVESHKDRKDLYFNVLGYAEHTPLVGIPFNQKASSGALFSYRINSATNAIYHGDDIVAHSLDVDIKKYDIEKFVNFGSMEVDPKIFDKAIGLSRNLIVAWKTHESSTIDDSVVINSDLVSTDELTTIDLHRHEYELIADSYDEESGIKEHEEFGFKSKSKPVHMTDEGLPLVGSNLKPGDIVIGVRKVKNHYSRGDHIKFLSSFDKPVKLEGTVEGQVVSAYIEHNTAFVLLATRKPIEEGDKLAGRHGNKGVIAKIIPREHMPYDPVTGIVPDIMLNPLGVPSRTNISQILEAALAFAGLKNNKIYVVSPYKENTLEYIKSEAEKAGIKPMMLMDGRTGQMFKRPINVGVLFMLKLEHMVSHKIRGVGISKKVDPVFNQPSKGSGHAGGQAFGEMETWCAMAVGATKVLQDLMSLQSDDLPSQELLREAVDEDLSYIDVQGTNNNDDLFRVFLRGLSVEPTFDPSEGFTFKPMTDAMIMGLSNHSIDINNKNSIRSTSIFGVTTNDKARFDTRKTWSWMPLHCEIVHPLWLVKGDIYKLIYGYREKGSDKTLERGVLTSEILKELIACKWHIEESFENGHPIFVFKEGVEEGKLTGMPALVHVLKNTSLEPLKAHYERKLSNAKSTIKIKESAQKLRDIEEFEESGLTLKDFVTTTLPIMPLSFRPPSMFQNTQQDFDYYYRRIIDEVVKHKNSDGVNPKSIYNIYLRIVEFCGFTYKGVKTNTAYKSLIRYFASSQDSNKKHSHIRESLLKKRVNFSGRTVIVPFSDMKRLPTQIGVPFYICLQIWRPQLVSLLNKTLNHYELNKDTWDNVLDVMSSNMSRFRSLLNPVMLITGKTHIELYDEIYAIISTYIEGRKNPLTGEWEVNPRVVIAGRQPSLHKFSIRAYHPFITHHKCIEIHPLNCKGYNADFDGDQMWVDALVNDETCEEAMRTMSPKFGIINPKDSSVILAPDQDIKLGVYYATMMHNNVENITEDDRYSQTHHYNSVSQISTDVDLDFLSIHDLVCLNLRGRKYLSTAGRFLFNAILPRELGFTEEPFTNPLKIENINPALYFNLKFDGIVSGGKGATRIKPTYVGLSKVTSWSYENLTLDENLQVLQGISELGFKFSDDSGITFSLEDLVESPNTQKIIDRANTIAEIINTRYYQGVITDESRKRSLIDLYSACREEVKKMFMSSFSRNNNIFIMFDSGARGTENQIIQACAMIGVLQKSKREDLEIPVLSSYARGTTSFDTLLLSFSTRTGVASTQNETADSGELTRTAVYMASGFTIVEHDCGRSMEKMKVMYGKFKNQIITPDGTTQDVSVLVGKKLSSEDHATMKYLRYFIGVDNELTDPAIHTLTKNKVLRVTCEDGEYRFLYDLDTLFKGLMMNREVEGLPKTTEIRGHNFATSDTLKHVEEKGMQYIDTRTILGCDSVGGVCARCYGVKYDERRLPYIGELIGIESAQSIGEPAAQLTLNTSHRGGVTGNGLSKGVDFINSLLTSGMSKKVPYAFTAPENGYLTYNLSQSPVDAVLFTDNGDEIPLRVSSPFIVESGEYVELGTPITEGFLPTKSELESPSLDEIRIRQMALLESYFRTFELSDITVNARHFEIFVRIQTSLVTVVNSSDPNFKAGRVYELPEINKSEGYVQFVFDTNGDKDVMEHYGGLETSVAHSDGAGKLGRFVMRQSKSKGSSLIGNLFYGQYVDGSGQRILTAPKLVVHVPSDNIASEKKLKDLEGVLISDIVKVEDTLNIDLSVDLDKLFNFDSPKPEKEKPVPYNKVDEEKEESDKPKLKDMSLFG